MLWSGLVSWIGALHRVNIIAPFPLGQISQEKLSMSIIEIEERRSKMDRREQQLKEREEGLRQKSKEIKNTVIKAKQVAAQLQLMAGQLDHLTNLILTEARNEI